MKLPRFVAIFAWVGLCGVLAAGPAARNTITEVNVAAGAVTVADGRGGFKTYQVRPTTEILLNNQKAKLEDVLPGMVASITGGDIGVASRIVVSAKASTLPNAKSAPALSTIRVAAIAIKANPAVVG